MNYALNQPNKEAFIKVVTEGLLPPPGYFGLNVAMNKKDMKVSTLFCKWDAGINPDEFEEMAENTGALLLDTRPTIYFIKACSTFGNIGL